MQSMNMIQIQEPEGVIPTCLHCGSGLDEDRDSIGFCRDCEDEHEKAQLEENYWRELATRRSQYSHLKFSNVRFGD